MEYPSREELERLLEKANKDAQEMLDKMTPEARAQAVAAAQKRIEEDEAAMQKLIEDARNIAGSSSKAAPKFCGCCGAPAGDGKICEYCGMPL